MNAGISEGVEGRSGVSKWLEPECFRILVLAKHTTESSLQVHTSQSCRQCMNPALQSWFQSVDPNCSGSCQT